MISSNEIVEPGFRGGNKLVLTLPLSIKNPMELSDTALEVTEAHDGSYQITITSAQLTSKILQIEYVEKIAEYLSFLINRDEKTLATGTFLLKLIGLISVRHPFAKSMMAIMKRFTYPIVYQ